MKRSALPGRPILLLALCCACLGAMATHAWCDPPPLPPYLGDGDLSGDAVMDEKDVFLFVKHWRKFASTGKLVAADFNGNKRIDHADAVFILGEFLRLYTVYHPATSAAVQPEQVAPLPGNRIASVATPKEGRAHSPAPALSAPPVASPTGPSAEGH